MSDNETVQREATPTPAAAPSSTRAETPRGGALKQALRTATYAEGAAMLSPVQQKGGGGQGDVHAVAADGLKGGGGAMPHLDPIQRSFGGYDISNVQAHTGSDAQSAAGRMGADAYATGNNVVFGKTPDLHTAAHEAAHVVQQKAGVSLKGGVGAAGDMYEQHADQVADAVVQGKSAEPLLAKFGGGGGGDGVQMKGNKSGGETSPKKGAKEATSKSTKTTTSKTEGSGTDSKDATGKAGAKGEAGGGVDGAKLLEMEAATTEKFRKKAEAELRAGAKANGVALSEHAIDLLMEATGKPDRALLKTYFKGRDLRELTDKEIAAAKVEITANMLASQPDNRALWDRVAAALDFATPPSGAVFWSGFPWAQHAAMNFPGVQAGEGGGGFAALENTGAGKLMNAANFIRASYGIGQTNMWNAFSARLASLATGEIHCVLAAWRPDTIWEKEEYPKLRERFGKDGATGWKKTIKYHRVLPHDPTDRDIKNAPNFDWGAKTTDESRSVLGTWVLPNPKQDGKLGAAGKDKGDGAEADRNAENDQHLMADITAKLSNIGDDMGQDGLKASQNPWLQYSVLTLKLGPSPVLSAAVGGTGEQAAIDVYKQLPPSKQAKFLYDAGKARQPTLVLFLLDRVRNEALLDASKGGGPEGGMDSDSAENKALIAAIQSRMAAEGEAAKKLGKLLGLPTQKEMDSLSSGKTLAPASSRAAGAGECKSFIESKVVGKNRGFLDAHGRAAWEVLVLAKRATAEEKPYVKNMGEAVWSLASGYQVKTEAREAVVGWNGRLADEDWKTVNELVESLRFFAMPWAEATGTLGLDPRGNMITDALSIRSDEYKDGADDKKHQTTEGEKSGKEILSNYAEKIAATKTRNGKKKVDVNVWSDMFMPWSMWSMAGNISRYMDKDVHLFGGEKGSRLNKNPGETVTSMEVHAGKSATHIDANQQVKEENIDVTEYIGLSPTGNPLKVMNVGPSGYEYREDGTVTRKGKVVKAGPRVAEYLTAMKQNAAMEAEEATAVKDKDKKAGKGSKAA